MDVVVAGGHGRVGLRLLRLLAARGDRATVEFTYVAGGYDIDAETGEPLESPVVLPAERVRVVVLMQDDRWLVDSYEAVR